MERISSKIIQGRSGHYQVKLAVNYLLNDISIF